MPESMAPTREKRPKQRKSYKKYTNYYTSLRQSHQPFKSHPVCLSREGRIREPHLLHPLLVLRIAERRLKTNPPAIES